MLTGLNARDREILAFEVKWSAIGGSTGDQIRRELALTKVRYYQMLNRILDDPVALEHDPANVYRLRALRDERAARRSSRIPLF